MIVLGIETSTAVCSAALFDESTGRYAETSISEKNLHAEKLVSIIDHLMQDSDRTRDAIGGIAVSIGPGSFTGLRIGLSVAKGLAFALDVPLTAVSTLYALAYKAFAMSGENDLLVASALDARRDEVYAGIFLFGNGKVIQREIPAFEEAVSVSKFLAHLESAVISQSGTSLVLIGDGVEKLQQAIVQWRTEEHQQRGALRMRVLPASMRYPSAWSVAEVGAGQLRLGEVSRIETLEPKYVKEFVPGPASMRSPKTNSI
ncbi:MAG: tRNA (adenosine(37)-N6)-threonylcarbamoyltransferase complex dimerization subunit type 1 TsaB [Bacteroidota bacterium]